MKQSGREKAISILTIIPSVIAIAIFVYGFILLTIRISLSDWQGILPDFSYFGLKSYFAVFKSSRFLISITNNVCFTAMFLAICVGGGLLLAVLLEKNLRGVMFFRTIYIFPLSISFVVTGIAWKWIFVPSGGINLLLNTLLTKIGVDNINIQWGWFIVQDQIGPFRLALIPVIIAASWQFMGYVMAMYLAGLMGIPIEIREAACVDGATEFQIYRKIILPLLKPITLSAMIILGHISLKIFDLIYVMTGRGPGFVTDVPSIFMYEAAFKAQRYSQGSVVGVIMLLMVAAVIIPYLTVSLRKGFEV